MSLYNAVRSSQKAKQFFRYPNQAAEDVEFDLIELERVPLGESFSVVVNLKVPFEFFYRQTCFTKRLFNYAE